MLRSSMATVLAWLLVAVVMTAVAAQDDERPDKTGPGFLARALEDKVNSTWAKWPASTQSPCQSSCRHSLRVHLCSIVILASQQYD